MRPQDTARIDELMAHGRKMVDVGYFPGARAYFQRAAEAGSAEAAFSVGLSYDPSFIAEIGAQGIQPDVKQARIWYERAKALGCKDADAKLKALSNSEARRLTPRSAGVGRAEAGGGSRRAGGDHAAAGRRAGDASAERDRGDLIRNGSRFRAR